MFIFGNNVKIQILIGLIPTRQGAKGANSKKALLSVVAMAIPARSRFKKKQSKNEGL